MAVNKNTASHDYVKLVLRMEPRCARIRDRSITIIIVSITPWYKVLLKLTTISSTVSSYYYLMDYLLDWAYVIKVKLTHSAFE